MMGLAAKVRDFMGIDEEDFDEEPLPAPAPATADAKPQRAAAAPARAAENFKTVLVKPERFDEAVPIADHIAASHIVVLNLEAAGPELSRRLIDFLGGAAYAKNGQFKRIAASTYIVTPYNVDYLADTSGFGD